METIYNYIIEGSGDADESQNSLGNKKEHFGNIIKKSNDYIYFILAFVIITILLFLAAMYDMNKPYMCLYK